MGKKVNCSIGTESRVCDGGECVRDKDVALMDSVPVFVVVLLFLWGRLVISRRVLLLVVSRDASMCRPARALDWPS